MPREELTEARTYWVDAIGGDDADSGLSPTAAFNTIQAALSAAYRLDTFGWPVTVQLAPGMIHDGFLHNRPLVGGGNITLRGDPNEPDFTMVRGIDKPAVFAVGGAVSINVLGFTVEAEGAGTTVGLRSNGGAHISITGPMIFGPCGVAHMTMGGGVIGMTSPYTIIAGARNHAFVSTCGQWSSASALANTVRNNPIFNDALVRCERGQVRLRGGTWTGSARGRKWVLDNWGRIDTVGLPMTWFPGDMPGLGLSGVYERTIYGTPGT